MYLWTTWAEYDGLHNYFAEQEVVDNYGIAFFVVHFFALVQNISIYFYDHSLCFHSELLGIYINIAENV